MSAVLNYRCGDACGGSGTGCKRAAAGDYAAALEVIRRYRGIMLDPGATAKA